MVDVEIPSHFVQVHQAASAEDLADLSSAGQALKAKGLTAEQIAEKITEAGWDKGFSTWYAQMLIGKEGDLRLVIPVAVVEDSRSAAAPDDAKRAAAKSAGTVLAVLASIWMVGWPFLGIRGNEALIAGIVGLALLWEGFARLALSKGLSRLHGACAMTSLVVQILLFFVWATVTGGRATAGDLDEEQQLYALIVLVMTMILPIGLSWLMFRVTTNQALSRQAKKASK